MYRVFKASAKLIKLSKKKFLYNKMDTKSSFKNIRENFDSKFKNMWQINCIKTTKKSESLIGFASDPHYAEQDFSSLINIFNLKIMTT